MRKIEVMGIMLRDYSVREAMRRISTYLNNGSCNTVDFITHDTLLRASNDEDMKRDIESMDITVATSNDILQAGSFSSRSREKEINSNLFLKGMLRKFAKEKRSIFLISETDARLQGFKSALCTFYDGLNIVSSAAMEEAVGGDDTIVNEINGCMPDIVLMNLESPSAETFIRENKMKLGSQLIIELRDASLRINGDGAVKRGGIGEMLLRKFFKNAADNYEKTAEAEDQDENPKGSPEEDDGKIVDL